MNWPALKAQIERHLSEDKNAHITTLIDYYGIHQHHNYPQWLVTQKLDDKAQALTEIEKGMKKQISPSNFQDRFIPYIQLYEFEGLLFSNIETLKNGFEESEFSDYSYLQQTIQQYPNPELINDSFEMAPSKRLEKIIKGYNKIVHGSLIAQDIGLITIRQKCPRFNQWISQIENLLV